MSADRSPADRSRADLGFGDALRDFDPGAWTPTPTRPAPAPEERREARRSAEALGFRSRETAMAEAGNGAEQGGDVAPQVATSPTRDEPPVRRRRTGRNQQFNLKARPETVAAYCQIADDNGWGLGETLEKAVELLEERFGRS